jgi:hypothetical protein
LVFFSLFLHCVVVFFLYSYIVLWCFSSYLHCVVVFFFIPILFCGVFLHTYIVLWCFSLYLDCFVVFFFIDELRVHFILTVFCDTFFYIPHCILTCFNTTICYVYIQYHYDNYNSPTNNISCVY